MACVCGAETPHNPPLLGCLQACLPTQLYEIPGWVRRAELLVDALVEGKFDAMFPGHQKRHAVEVLTLHIADMLEQLEASCGGRQ